MLFDYDNNAALEELFKEYENVKTLNNSLADKRAKYRKFSDIIKLDFNVLDDCIKKAENILLISCYTFSEKLLKNTIYELIEKDNNGNHHVNKFIDSKIPSEKFSPNVLTNELVKSLNAIGCEFRFILPKKHDALMKYDDMIRARHQYAHANNYTFRLEQFEKILEVLEYINFEISHLVQNKDIKEDMITDYDEIKNITTKIKNCENRSMKNPNIKKIKKLSKQFYRKYINSLGQLRLFKDIFNSLLTISQFDLRKSTQKNFYYNEITRLEEKL